MTELLKLSWQPQLQSPSLVVGWSGEGSTLGAKVTDYLNKKLGGQSFGEIEPTEFFPLAGVTIEDDLVQFPESKFYAFPKNDLVVLRSDPPSYDWYRFLTLILDIAETCQVKEILAIGGMVSLSAHTAPRQLLGTFNSPELKEALSSYNLDREMNYETPPGQRPTLNSFFLWVARRRNIPGVSLWVPIPFYLLTVDDPRAEKRVLEFLNRRSDLGMDLTDLDEEIKKQNVKLARARESSPEIDEAIGRLESNLTLSPEENQKLIREIEKFLRGKGD